LVYFIIVKSIAPGQIRTPIAGGDNYFDRGGSSRKRIAHRLIDEWSTETPRSAIISSMCE
jgi:hypothetical protein